MHFSHLNHGSGNKATKLAVVAGLHVLAGVAFVHSINTRHIQMPKIEDVLVMIQPDVPPPPPPPPNPPTPVRELAPPDIVVPRPEIVPPPLPDPAPTARIDPDPAPVQPARPTQQVQAEAAPARPAENSGAMRTAVLADANGCATPGYPANSLRNGDTGTVTLALLVGPDGKVTSSRVQHSSGHRELDRAAVNALSLCRFKPAMNNGMPEAGWAQIAYVWALD